MKHKYHTKCKYKLWTLYTTDLEWHKKPAVCYKCKRDIADVKPYKLLYYEHYKRPLCDECCHSLELSYTHLFGAKFAINVTMVKRWSELQEDKND